jgi:hypothetical protein
MMFHKKKALYPFLVHRSCLRSDVFRVECPWIYLKAKLLEEPLVLSTLVAVFKSHADLEACLLAFDGIFKVLDTVFAFKTYFRDTVTGWHQMIVVDKLKR